MIYSSGSVAAQKLLFKYTEDGDLSGFVEGYFDTINAGMKGERESYTKIFEAMRKVEGDGKRVEDISKWLFCSDRVEEVDAAKEAGMQAVVVVREGNAPLSEGDKKRHVLIERFDEIGSAEVK